MRRFTAYEDYALRLLQAAEAGVVRFARLVGDDRVHVEAANGSALVRPAVPVGRLFQACLAAGGNRIRPLHTFVLSRIDC